MASCAQRLPEISANDKICTDRNVCATERGFLGSRFTASSHRCSKSSGFVQQFQFEIPAVPPDAQINVTQEPCQATDRVRRQAGGEVQRQYGWVGEGQFPESFEILLAEVVGLMIDELADFAEPTEEERAVEQNRPDDVDRQFGDEPEDATGENDRRAAKVEIGEL